MITFLKVKIKSLASEAKIIRKEEDKAKSYFDWELFDQLYGHRKGVVAQEQRATLLAYGFLKGTPCFDIEMRPRDIPDYILVRARRMATKYGAVYGIGIYEFEEWLQKGIEDQIVYEQIDSEIGNAISIDNDTNYFTKKLMDFDTVP